MNAVSKYLDESDVILSLQAADKRSVFEAIGRHMQQTHGVSAKMVVSSLQRRESAGSTAIGLGVAIPHARVNELDRIQMLYVRLASPLEFDSPDAEKVTHVVVLLVPAPAVQEHLDVLANLTALFLKPAFRDSLHGCQAPLDVKRVFSGACNDTTVAEKR